MNFFSTMNDLAKLYWRRVSFVLAMLLAMGAQAQSVSYSSFDDPLGIGSTYAHGIAGNQIVGEFISNSIAHGFMYDGTNYTTLDPTNSQVTSAQATDGHRVVGYFIDLAGTHGFVWTGSNYITLNCPKAVGSSLVTEAFGIDGTNIVGYYLSNSIPHGFLYNGVGYVTIDDPGATYGTYVQGISGTNVVGLGYDLAPGNGHSFTYDGKTFTTITNTIGAIDAFAISSNHIAGYFYDGSSDHGFVWDRTNYTTLDYPQANLTAAYGIDGSTVVGTYFDSKNSAHGFKATISQTVVLTIRRSGNQVIVTWPLALTGWKLQTNSSLNGTSWNSFSGSIANNSATNTLPSTGSLFFRLTQ
jgi:hypothetical protein